MRRGSSSNRGAAAALVALGMMVIAVAACSQPLQSAPSTSVPTPAGPAGACNSPYLSISNYAIYTDPDDTLWVIGDAQNTSSGDLLLATLCISVNAGDTTRVVNRYVGPMLLKAGERAPFRALLGSVPPGALPKIRFSAEAQPASQHPKLAAKVQRSFGIGNLVPTLRLDTDEVEVTGVLTNTSDLPVKSIYLAIGLYTSSGIVVGVAEENLQDLDWLKPGAAVPFKVVVSHLVSPTSDLKLRAVVEGRYAEATAMSGADAPDESSNNK